MSDCIKCGNHHKPNASIDNGKWFAAKVLRFRCHLFRRPAGVTFHLIVFLLSLSMGTCITSDNNGVTGLHDPHPRLLCSLLCSLDLHLFYLPDG